MNYIYSQPDKTNYVSVNSLIQPKKKNGTNFSPVPIQKKGENNTGLPDNIKSNVESLSEISMDDVRVHYNSPKPAQMQALAYTQGTDIHVAPGQEKHLSHEAWHVVQQAQGRVDPTFQMKGVGINDNADLEQEADEMGNKAKDATIPKTEKNILKSHSSNIIQGYFTVARIPAMHRQNSLNCGWFCLAALLQFRPLAIGLPPKPRFWSHGFSPENIEGLEVKPKPDTFLAWETMLSSRGPLIVSGRVGAMNWLIARPFTIFGGHYVLIIGTARRTGQDGFLYKDPLRGNGVQWESYAIMNPLMNNDVVCLP